MRCSERRRAVAVAIDAPRGRRRWVVSQMRVILFICLCFFLLIALLAYGHCRYPRLFQARVPWTNMGGVQQAVGKPLHISTNADGTVRWDYTHWWSGEAKVYFDTNGNYVRTFTDF